MNNEINNSDTPSFNIPGTPEKPEFDLFARQSDDHLKEQLAKGTYEWTNKYTKILAVAVIAVTLLSIGAWYGHRSATTQSAAGVSLSGALGGNNFGSGFSRRNGASGAASAGTGSPGTFGGGAGPRVTGTVSKVSNGEVTIKLDDPTQISSLKAGDTTRVTNTTGFGAPAGAGIPSAKPSTKSSVDAKSPTGTSQKPTTSATKPSVGSSGGARGGFFSDPTISACLKKSRCNNSSWDSAR